MIDIKEVLKAIETYNNTDQKHIKNNINDIRKAQNMEMKGFSTLLEVPINTVKGYCNPSNSSKISFESAIRICCILDTSLDELVRENEKEIGRERGTSKKWTDEHIQEFIKDYEASGEDYTSKKWGIAKRSAKTYYLLFKKQEETNTVY